MKTAPAKVSANSLKWWRWQIGRQTASRPEPTLLPVVFTAGERPSTPAPPIAIELDDRLVFRVQVGTDEQYVAALVAAVRSTC